jgi:RNA polymerase sigma factor (sigma-70 family)
MDYPSPGEAIRTMYDVDIKSSGRFLDFCESIHDDELTIIALAQSYLEARNLGIEPDLSVAEGWRKFYSKFDPMIRSLARRSHRADSESLDGVQEVWVVLIARLPLYRHDPERGRFRNWLSVLARHALSNMRRRRSGRPLETMPRDQMIDLAEGGENDPAASCERADSRESVRRALEEFRNRLGAGAYKAACLHWLEGRTAEEVAVRLGLSYGQVWGLLSRAKRKLRDYFDREQFF